MDGRRALIAALVLLSGVAGTKAGSEGRAHNFSAEGLAKVSDYIRSEVAAGTFPGAVKRRVRMLSAITASVASV